MSVGSACLQRTVWSPRDAPKMAAWPPTKERRRLRSHPWQKSGGREGGEGNALNWEGMGHLRRADWQGGRWGGPSRQRKQAAGGLEAKSSLAEKSEGLRAEIRGQGCRLHGRREEGGCIFRIFNNFLERYLIFPLTCISFNLMILTFLQHSLGHLQPF